MNVILIREAELDDRGRVELTDRRAAHLVDTIGCRPGQLLRIGVIGRSTGSAEVIDLAPGRVALRVTDVGEVMAPARAPEVELIIAVPRPKALARLLQTAASFGVRRIDLVNAWRVERAYFQSGRLNPDALAAELITGCEQGGVTWLPEVAVHRLFVPFIDQIAADGSRPVVRLVAHPAASRTVESAVETIGRTLVAIGPEGGWIDAELASLAAAGFEQVSAGPWRLRTEIALAALLAQLALLARRP